MTPPKKNSDDGLAKPQPTIYLGEILRAVVIAAILAIGGNVVLASRLEERVKANRDIGEMSLNVLRQKDDEHRRNIEAIQAAQKEHVAIMQGMIQEVTRSLSSESRGQTAFREEVVRRLTMLDERMGYLAKSVDEIKQRK